MPKWPGKRSILYTFLGLLTLFWLQNSFTILHLSQGKNPVNPDQKDCSVFHEYPVYRPTCNIMHSMDMMKASYLAQGSFNDVWQLEDVVIKTLRWKRDLVAALPNIAMDAWVMGELSQEKSILDVYGACGSTLMGPIQPRVFSLYEKEDNSTLLFQQILDVSRGLVAMDKISVRHNDWKEGQLLLTEDGHVQWSDFNLASLVPRDRHGYPCSTAKSSILAQSTPAACLAKCADYDSFLLGNLLFRKLTGLAPWSEQWDDKICPDLIASGTEPLRKNLMDVAIRQLETCPPLRSIHDILASAT